MNEEDANDKDDRMILWAVKRNFFAGFKDYLSRYMHLKDNDTCQEIVEDLQEMVDKGMDVNQGLSRVIPMHQTKFDALFEPDESEEEETSGDNED